MKMRKHKNTSSNVIDYFGTPGVLLSSAFVIELASSFLDTLLFIVKGLSLNIINNGLVQALCSLVSHLATSIIFIWLLLKYDEFPEGEEVLN